MADRGALIGSGISGAAGAVWALWGSSGLSGAAAALAAVVGVVVGAAVVVTALLRGRTATSSGTSMFRARPYQLTVLGEVIGFAVGTALLGSLGRPDLIVCWIAFVVGVHFLAFGYFFVRVFYVIGTAVIAAAVAGVVVAVAVGPGPAHIAVTGLLTAAILLTAGVWGLIDAQRRAA